MCRCSLWVRESNCASVLYLHKGEGALSLVCQDATSLVQRVARIYVPLSLLFGHDRVNRSCCTPSPRLIGQNKHHGQLLTSEKLVRHSAYLTHKLQTNEINIPKTKDNTGTTWYRWPAHMNSLRISAWNVMSDERSLQSHNVVR